MFRLPYVPLADELIEKAFSAAKKEVSRTRSKGSRKPREEKLWRGEAARVKTVSGILRGDLSAVVNHFPRFEQLPPFYQRLLDLKVGRDRYKRNLGAVNWAVEGLKKLERGATGSIRRSKSPDYAKQFMGRSASIVKQVSSDLKSLVEIKDVLLSFPTVKEVPTLVVAGYPNSGKSTFVRNLTGSHVEVAGYPFTTKSLNIGYKKIRYEEVQVIDSPGLLDRPMGRRNKIELEAVLALSELADKILFLIDPTQELSPQLNLLSEIRENFKVPVVVAVNKADAVDAEKFNKVAGIVFSANDQKDCERVFEKVMAG
jgi:nucleolar GTP-binding protein